ncbi:hypothetical protein [Rhizobium grahamii]|uniref:Type III secretion protein n=1 Tax=Rhizobium grahamii TaxID=1120045 RepID=A0A370KHK4_9HYPH|nr:hypothetical protein [Rhizobium grahamii]RDJ04498.1 hypothetical protein B5K06_27025 [Rhizobium grahamii]
MDVTSDRMNRVHASRLRLLKDLRENRAVRELSKAEAQRDIAAAAVQRACRELAIAEQRRATAEVELYQQLVSLDYLSATTLDRYHFVLERLAAKVGVERRTFDDARIAQQQAESEAAAAKAHWAGCSAVNQKWQQIEDDVKRADEICLEAAAEIEVSDDVLTRHRRSSLAQLSNSSI